jgi:hypothetical protein
MFGTHEDSFEMLPRLLLAIQELNPRTIIEWLHNRQLDNWGVQVLQVNYEASKHNVDAWFDNMDSNNLK